MNSNAELLKELRIDRNARQAPPPRRGLWIGIAIAVAVVALLVLGGWWLFGRAKPVDVQTAAVVAFSSGGADASSVLDATGYVVARRMATVSSKITGKVRDIRIEEGQHVEAGDIMATLDPVDADAQRDLATAQAAAARSQVTGVQAQLREASVNAERLGTLVQKQLVSKAQYDEAIAQRDALRAQLATAQHNAKVAADQLRIAGNGVDNTIVRAPFEGVVIAKAAQPGEIVSPLSAGGGFTRTGIGTIVDMDSLEVEVDVGESYIGRVKPDMPVESTLNAYPDWRIPGKVIAIIPTADRGKATVKVRVGLDQKDPRIVPDMGVAVRFLEKAAPQGEQAPRSASVPAAAIDVRDGGSVAFVVDGNGEEGTVERRALKLGGTRGDDRQVLSGLSAGETVVLDPPAALEDGGKVRIVAAGESKS
jgi:RND family efflux transporter MFP subunit